MYETSREDVMKGGAYWTEQIQKAGLTDKLLPFNDVLVGNEAPAGNVEPMLRDVVLDGVKVDIYHWDYPAKDTSSNRIYIYRKERVAN
jgi:hypothetical protein